VHIFAWKLAVDGLATQDKRKWRGLVPSDLCDICGNGVETGHHAMITCTKARALWQEMRKEWQLPDDEQLRETRPDWLPLLLGRLDRHKKNEDADVNVEAMVPHEQHGLWVRPGIDHRVSKIPG
jgi:hypothetical protein